MDLIICSTPYQLLTSVCLKLSKVLNDNTDLVIFSYFPGAENIKENIDRINIFKSVKISNVKTNLSRCQKGKCSKYIWNSLFYLDCKRYTTKYGFNKSYDRIFYSFVDPSLVIMARYYLSLNPNVEFLGFEDGLTDYYNSQHGDHFNRPRWASWFNIPERIFKRKCVYFYNPELAPDSQDKYQKIKINIDFSEEQNIRLVNKVFNFSENMIINEKVLYFDQLPHRRVGITDEFNLQIVEHIKNHFKDNYIIKIAPRRQNSLYKNKSYSLYEYQNVPFELLCLNSNYNNKILITNISSACFMPKMLFGYEPVLIFLFYITHQKIDADIDNFIQRFINEYENKEKIFFPRTEEELDKILNEL